MPIRVGSALELANSTARSADSNANGPVSM